MQKALTATYDHVTGNAANSVVSFTSPVKIEIIFQCMHNKPKQKTVQSLVLNVSSFSNLEITRVTTLQN
jgi:hypothetical protein